MNKNVIGIDIGGTEIKGGIFDSKGKLIKKGNKSSLPEKGEKYFISNIVSLGNLLKKENIKASSIGIGIAGVLDKKRRVLIESPNLPYLRNTPLKKLIESELDLPVFIENDANTAALGELWAGNGKMLDNFLLITLGTGIGSGLILNGKLWSGETGKAGEFGHLIVKPKGVKCACGKRGCLEAYSSGSAITRMAKEALASGKTSFLQTIYKENPASLTPETIYNAAVKGDKLSIEIFNEAALYLAIGISNINNLLDIHNFIIGGGVSKSFHIFEKILLEEVNKRVFKPSKDKIRIIISKLGNDAGIFGAGYLARKGL